MSSTIATPTGVVRSRKKTPAIKAHRTVYIRVPERTRHDHQGIIDAILGRTLRFDDHLLYVDTDPGANECNAVVSYAERHGIYADPLSVIDEADHVIAIDDDYNLISDHPLLDI